MITSATDLIEREGAAAFSLRALAKDLNVRPAALYNHVENLDDLLDTIAARFVAGFDLTATEQPWPDWVRAVATKLHRHLGSRPELANLALSRAPDTAAGPALMHRFHEHLESEGVSRTVAHLAWHAVLTVVIGSVHQANARNRDQTDTFDAVLAVIVDGLVDTASRRPDDRTTALLANHMHG